MAYCPLLKSKSLEHETCLALGIDQTTQTILLIRHNARSRTSNTTFSWFKRNLEIRPRHNLVDYYRSKDQARLNSESTEER